MDGWMNLHLQYQNFMTRLDPGDIHYQMLKHLPGAALETLLDSLNDTWISGNFPES